jgi:hypothetical protein
MDLMSGTEFGEGDVKHARKEDHCRRHALAVDQLLQSRQR